MEKKMRGSYVDGSYVPPQGEQVIVKVKTRTNIRGHDESGRMEN